MSNFEVANSKNDALIGFYRRIKSKHGAGVAIKATARKIAVMFYNSLTKGFDFVEQGLKKYQETYEIHLRKRLEKQVKILLLTLVPNVVH